jgi:hypothetical protein
MESSSSMGALSTGRDSDEEASFVFWLPGRGGGGGAASSQFVIFEEKKVTEEDGGTTIVWLLVPPFELPAPMMLYLFVIVSSKAVQTNITCNKRDNFRYS